MQDKKDFFKELERYKDYVNKCYIWDAYEHIITAGMFVEYLRRLQNSGCNFELLVFELDKKIKIVDTTYQVAPINFYQGE
jgi:hypothetical protein